MKDTVFTAWHYVMTVELRTKFNWQGNPGARKETKRGLEITNVKKEIFGRLFFIVLQYYLYYNFYFCFLITGVIEQLSSYTTNFDVIKHTKKAIRHAPQTAKGKAN